MGEAGGSAGAGRRWEGGCIGFKCTGRGTACDVDDDGCGLCCGGTDREENVCLPWRCDSKLLG